MNLYVGPLFRLHFRRCEHFLMLNTTRALIDLSAMRHNLEIVRALCPEQRVLVMVKADGYGHGMLRTAQALAHADGIGVARLDEALQLRRAGLRLQRILLMGTLLDQGEIEVCAHENIDIVVHDLATVDRLCARHKATPLRVWLKLDSGMHRLGLAPADFHAADTRLRAQPGVEEIIHMTHFAASEDFAGDSAERQFSCFTTVHGGSESATSVANSAAIIGRPGMHGDWVRPGIMIYGDNPLAKTHPQPLEPAMTLLARVLALRLCDTGERIGYNGIWTCPRPSRIATLGIGYGDGYPRHARNGTPVWIRGKRATLVGRVSMDSITIDVTDVDNVRVGDEAELWGKHLPAAEIAACAETISYELFTSIGQRVVREYSE
jgi:alanine racemase